VLRAAASRVGPADDDTSDQKEDNGEAHEISHGQTDRRRKDTPYRRERAIFLRVRDWFSGES
jgi:hypothetical protein